MSLVKSCKLAVTAVPQELCPFWGHGCCWSPALEHPSPETKPGCSQECVCYLAWLNAVSRVVPRYSGFPCWTWEFAGFSEAESSQGQVMNSQKLGLFARRAVVGLQSWGASDAPGGCGQRRELRAGGCSGSGPPPCSGCTAGTLSGHQCSQPLPWGRRWFPTLLGVCTILHRPMSPKTASPSAFRSDNAVLSR